jgi:hypothetical protein
MPGHPVPLTRSPATRARARTESCQVLPERQRAEYSRRASTLNMADWGCVLGVLAIPATWWHPRERHREKRGASHPARRRYCKTCSFVHAASRVSSAHEHHTTRFVPSQWRLRTCTHRVQRLDRRNHRAARIRLSVAPRYLTLNFPYPKQLHARARRQASVHGKILERVYVEAGTS